MKYLLGIFFFFLLICPFRAQYTDMPEYVKHERLQAAKKLRGTPSGQTGNYDWIYQRLVLTLDPRNYYVTGQTDVYFKFYEDSDRFILDLSHELQVSEVLYHGQPVNFSQNDSDELIIDLPSVISAGILDSVHIAYAGRPPYSGMGSFEVSEHNRIPVLWTLSEPYGAKDWWPCKQNLTDKLDSIDMILRYPVKINGKIMQGVSNGLLMGEHIDHDTKISHWRHRHSIPAYLVAVAITNYSRYSHQAGIYRSFPIDNYVYPEDSAWAVNYTPVVVDVMNFYEEKFGEYPFSDEKYGHAQFGWNGGMEHTTVSFVGGFSRGLLAHELAHQWFGDDVTCASWSDIWINEGFATYSEALIQQHMDGQEAFRLWKQYAVRLIDDRPSGSVYVFGNDTLNISRVFSWPLSYLKGAMVLHMLRFINGDEIFFHILKQFRERFAADFAATEDFKSIVEEITGEDYGEFFNDWVYGKGYPSFETSWMSFSDNTYRVVIQQTPSDPDVDFFETPVKLRLSSTTHDKVFDTIVSLNRNNQIFFISTDAVYDKLELDPDYDIIRGTSQVHFGGNMEWNDSEIFLFPNPASDEIRFFVKDRKNVRNTFIFDSGGKMVYYNLNQNGIVDIQHLSSGIYFLGIIYDNGKILTAPFIKY